MFNVISLPATFGDCFWIQYGDEHDPHHVLIDGGTAGTRTHIRNMFAQMPTDKKPHFELVVVSHIDNDHIAGFLELLEEEPTLPAEDQLGLTIGDLWFNGWPQLNGLTNIHNMENIEIFGIDQGERLTTQIRKQGLPWNDAFGEAAVVVPPQGELPKKTLPGGMVLYLLSPLPQGLQKLKEEWKSFLLEEGLVLSTPAPDEHPIEGVEIFGTPSTGILDIDMLAESPFDPDGSVKNRSSIAILAEFDGKRAVFAADAHADALLSGITRLKPEQAAQFNLFKISHHGAQGTTSRELIKAVNCSRYLFSSNGSNYSHPHAEAVSRVIVSSGQEPELIFNYKKDRNRAWEDMAQLDTGHRFCTTYPTDGQEGITVEL